VVFSSLLQAQKQGTCGKQQYVGKEPPPPKKKKKKHQNYKHRNGGTKKTAISWNFLAEPVFKTSYFPLQEVRVRSLVEELRSHMPTNNKCWRRYG